MRSLDVMPGLIEGEVSGSGGQRYRQSVTWKQGRGAMTFAGHCSCPMSKNCKHVVALLLDAAGRGGAAAPSAEPALPYAVVAWLEQLQQAARAPLAAPKAVKRGYRLEFVLMREGRDARVLLHMCRARLRADGGVASVAVVADSYSMQRDPPAYLAPAELHQLHLFFALMGLGSHFGPARVAPKEEMGAQLLRMLLDAGRLSWADSTDDLKAGLLHPLAAGPVRAGGPAWQARDGGDTLRLGWQFDDGAPVDCVLSTEPVLYLHRHALGELALAEGARAIPIGALGELVARAPELAGRDRPAVSRRLAERGLAALVPPPQPLQQRLREDIAARPFLLLGSVEDGRGRWQDFAVLAFDYDGLRGAFGAAGHLQRHGGAGGELIARDRAAERAAGATLAALGFTLIGDPESPLRTVAGALQLASQAQWLDFAATGLARLRAAGNAWFELELGVLVDGARVPLLPVLVQLIREAPREFDAAALAARADDEPLLANLPGGARVALPWGRVKPILAALGELYFKDGVGAAIRLPELDAARPAELEAGAQLRSQIVILEALLKLRQVCCDPRLVKAAGAKSAAPSAKLGELMAMLDALLDEGRKVLVFSQFTSMLALIEDELKARGVGYALLTGATKDRAGQVAAFQRGAVPVFLISLKGGGVGLNLTAADTVIHYDPWWNPAAENQASDRAWRIGQDKPVFVYKLIAKGTLEEKIQLMQRKKADLADAVLAGGEARGLHITQDDLQAIFAPL